jgi:hypothetical protein
MSSREEEEAIGIGIIGDSGTELTMNENKNVKYCTGVYFVSNLADNLVKDARY